LSGEKGGFIYCFSIVRLVGLPMLWAMYQKRALRKILRLPPAKFMM
jgi:hypothetical protein